MSDLKIKLILLFIGLIIGIVWMLIPDKDAENEKKYIRSLNLKINGVVKKVMPTRNEDHGYGVIYLQNFTSNKRSEYECAYKDQYLFCKIYKREAIIVTGGITEINPNDSVSYST